MGSAPGKKERERIASMHMLPPAIVQQIDESIQRRSDTGLQWIAPKDWHLTFVTHEVLDRARLPELRKKLQDAVHKHTAFDVKLSGLRTFFNFESYKRQRPSITLFADPDGESQIRLQSLWADLRLSTYKRFQQGRKVRYFHVSLAKGGPENVEEIETMLAERKMITEAFRMDAVQICRTRTQQEIEAQPTASKYEVIDEIQLRCG